MLPVTYICINYYCDVLPLNTSNNSWVADFCISIYWIYIRRCLQSLITSHKPVTSSGSYSWGTAVSNSCDELLLQTTLADCYDLTASIINPSCFYNLGDPLLVCSLPRYMHFYIPLLSCNNSPLFWLPRLFCLQNCWEQFSCIRGYIILMDYVSVAWKRIFPAWGNSAFQTTCHIMLYSYWYVKTVTKPAYM
jgi:hypothetical protein